MDRRVFVLGAAMSALTPPARAAAPALHVPPEDARHEATLMMWPASRRVHRDRFFLELLQETILRIANTIAQFEPVILLAEGGLHAGLRARLSRGVTLWDVPTEDLWARDAGPLIARQGARRVLSHIRFNGWGRKQVHRRDGRVAEIVARRLGFERIDSRLTGEAGGVDHDGHGLLIAHESSWVIANRNPGLSRATIEQRLLRAYGAQRMIWSKGLKGQDITDYHIDSLARFTAPGRVLINMPARPDPRDPFHRAADRTLAALRGAGLGVDVIHEPQRRRVAAQDFVASYANFYLCNGAVIVAQFGDPQADRAARRALARHFPGRQIVALNVDALGEVGGGIHCATQQIPA